MAGRIVRPFFVNATDPSGVAITASLTATVPAPTLTASAMVGSDDVLQMIADVNALGDMQITTLYLARAGDSAAPYYDSTGIAPDLTFSNASYDSGTGRWQIVSAGTITAPLSAAFTRGNGHSVSVVATPKYEGTALLTVDNGAGDEILSPYQITQYSAMGIAVDADHSANGGGQTLTGFVPSQRGTNLQHVMLQLRNTAPGGTFLGEQTLAGEAQLVINRDLRAWWPLSSVYEPTGPCRIIVGGGGACTASVKAIMVASGGTGEFTQAQIHRMMDTWEAIGVQTDTRTHVILYGNSILQGLAKGRGFGPDVDLRSLLDPDLYAVSNLSTAGARSDQLELIAPRTVDRAMDNPARPLILPVFSEVVNYLRGGSAYGTGAAGTQASMAAWTTGRPTGASIHKILATTTLFSATARPYNDPPEREQINDDFRANYATTYGCDSLWDAGRTSFMYGDPASWVTPGSPYYTTDDVHCNDYTYMMQDLAFAVRSITADPGEVVASLIATVPAPTLTADATVTA